MVNSIFKDTIYFEELFFVYLLSFNFMVNFVKKIFIMTLPKYLIADNSQLTDDIFVLHTEFPRFLLNINTDDIEWFDEFSKQEAEENAGLIENVVAGAYTFFDEEMKNYES